MTSRIRKLSILIIAAVLLVAMAFAGAVSAVSITADEWNALGSNNDLINGNASYEFTGSGIIYPKFNGSTGFTPDHDMTLDFADYQGTFAGDTNASTNGLGALFGYVNLHSESAKRTLTIQNLNLTTVTVKANSGNKVGGIVGYFYGKSTDKSILNLTNCNLINSSITGASGASGSQYVGGLVGYANFASVNVEDCSAKHCDVVSGSQYVGGMVGDAATASFEGCNVTNSTVASTGSMFVGGLVGYANSARFESCGVENTSVYGGSYCVGGLVGNPVSANGIEGCEVNNCVIASGGENVGGLVGSVNSASGIGNCHVVNCTMSGSDRVGGLVGEAGSANGWIGNEVTNCAVNSTAVSNWNTNYVCGNKPLMENPANCSVTGNNFIKNGTITDTTITPTLSYGWNTIQYVTANGTTNVTNLGTYGEKGGYGVGSYDPSEPGPTPTPTTYPIYITNKTGTYQLMSALTTVYGDYGADNGTAELAFVNEKPILTLTNFKASNTTGNVPIINASVANLTIKLVGESNLTGSYADIEKGLLYAEGNLTIEGTEDSSKLLVNNTNSGSKPIISISVMKNITIDNAKVTVIANNGNGGASGISSSNNINITGSKTVVIANAQSSTRTYALLSQNGNVSIELSAVVEANATSTSNMAYSIYSYQNIEIDSSANVTANAQGSTTTYGLLSQKGNVSIESNAVVEANANSTNSAAYSIKAGNITIEDGATVIATANASDQGEAYSIKSESCLVINESVVTAKAKGGHDYVEALAGNTIVVSGENTVIEATAIDTNNTYATYAFGGLESLSIISVKKITAITSSVYRNASSFAYGENGACDFTGLATGYTFSNATSSGAAPTSYAAFNNSNNWHIVYDEKNRTVSNYKAVTIEKGSTPTPSPSSGGSSSKHSGYTQILSQGQVAPTPYATTTPTAAPTASPTPASPTAKPTTQATTQPTQSSPAPIAGLIAGLGAAALVLARMRR